MMYWSFASLLFPTIGWIFLSLNSIHDLLEYVVGQWSLLWAKQTTNNCNWKAESILKYHCEQGKSERNAQTGFWLWWEFIFSFLIIKESDRAGPSSNYHTLEAGGGSTVWWFLKTTKCLSVQILMEMPAVIRNLREGGFWLLRAGGIAKVPTIYIILIQRFILIIFVPCTEGLLPIFLVKSRSYNYAWARTAAIKQKCRNFRFQKNNNI